MTERKPRNSKYGNDFFQEISIPNSDETFSASYWDLWIAIILKTQFYNDIDKMISDLRTKAKTSINLKYEYEELLNHVEQLHQTLIENKLNFSDILQNTDDDFIKKQKPKAKRKITEMQFLHHERSTWMINTPRATREEISWHGYWYLFPINPQKHENSLEKLYKNGLYTRRESHILVNKLRRYLDKHEKKASNAELLALYRAFLTVVLKKMESVDDSYGIVGDLYQEVFQGYFMLDRNELDMELTSFFQDLLELIIWEDYGLTDYEMPNFFKNLSSAEIPLVKSILLQQKDELKSLDLDYQAKKASTLLKKL